MEDYLKSPKTNLKYYVPSLVELVDNKDFPWNKIERMFTEKLNQRVDSIDGEHLLVEASIYDIIVQVKKDNIQATGLLHYFNHLFKELLDHLSATEKLHIRSNVKSMLKSFDSQT